MLKFLQLFPDMMDDHFEPLTDEEVGIIVRAAMAYAFQGTEPGFERRSVLDLTWRRMKRHIDNCETELSKMAELGSRGGKNSAAKRGQAKPSETQAEPSEGQAEASEAEAEPSGGQAKPSESNHNQDQNQDHNQNQYQNHNQDKDKDQDKDKGDTNGGRAARFRPPTIDDVKWYCRDRHNSVDPQKFLDYYTSNGWKVGKNPMKDWRAAVRSWERNDYGGSARAAPDYQKRQYTETEFAAMEVDLDNETPF